MCKFAFFKRRFVNRSCIQLQKLIAYSNPVRDGLDLHIQFNCTFKGTQKLTETLWTFSRVSITLERKGLLNTAWPRAIPGQCKILLNFGKFLRYTKPQFRFKFPLYVLVTKLSTLYGYGQTCLHGRKMRYYLLFIHLFSAVNYCHFDQVKI